MRFRKEIAGLRAVAVMSVVIFHAGVSQMSGGFVGVDIFFVISGFLIISIICKNLNNQSFSFSDFYAGRAKRLFPAAIATILFTTLFAFLVLTPKAYTSYSESAVASLGFVANIYFHFNTGYFDQASEVMPLLHMWSLGVEEQFYLISPLLIFLSYKIKQTQGVLVSLSLILAVSFFLMMMVGRKNGMFAFYELPTRAWQFSVGGLIAFLPQIKNRNLGNIFSGIGLLVILVSIFTISHNRYPSWNALLPTLGCAFLIYFTPTKQNFVRLLLSNKAFVFIGKISYSTYLWHWPIIVFYRIYINERPFSNVETIILVLFSLLSGYVSWLLIEEKFRYSKLPDAVTIRRSIIVAVLVSLIPIAVIRLSGLPSRMEGASENLTNLKTMWEYSCNDSITFPMAGEACVVGKKWVETSKHAVLWGDSHSEILAPFFDNVARQNSMSVVIGPRSCPPFIHERSLKHHDSKRAYFTSVCTNKQDSTLDWLKDNPDVNLVVLASAWAGYTMENALSSPDSDSAEPTRTVELMGSALEDVIDKITALGRDVLILGDFPRPMVNLNACFVSNTGTLLRENACYYEFNYLAAQDVRKTHESTSDLLAGIASGRSDVDYINVHQNLCDKEQCPTFINGEFIYRDSNHTRRNLSEGTNRKIASMMGLEKFINEYNSGKN